MNKDRSMEIVKLLDYLFIDNKSSYPFIKIFETAISIGKNNLEQAPIIETYIQNKKDNFIINHKKDNYYFFSQEKKLNEHIEKKIFKNFVLDPLANKETFPANYIPILEKYWEYIEGTKIYDDFLYKFEPKKEKDHIYKSLLLSAPFQLPEVVSFLIKKVKLSPPNFSSHQEIFTFIEKLYKENHLNINSIEEKSIENHIYDSILLNNDLLNKKSYFNHSIYRNPQHYGLIIDIVKEITKIEKNSKYVCYHYYSLDKKNKTSEQYLNKLILNIFTHSNSDNIIKWCDALHINIGKYLSKNHDLIYKSILGGILLSNHSKNEKLTEINKNSNLFEFINNSREFNQSSYEEMDNQKNRLMNIFNKFSDTSFQKIYQYFKQHLDKNIVSNLFDDTLFYLKYSTIDESLSKYQKNSNEELDKFKNLTSHSNTYTNIFEKSRDIGNLLWIIHENPAIVYEAISLQTQYKQFKTKKTFHFDDILKIMKSIHEASIDIQKNMGSAEKLHVTPHYNAPILYINPQKLQKKSIEWAAFMLDIALKNKINDNPIKNKKNPPIKI